MTKFLGRAVTKFLVRAVTKMPWGRAMTKMSKRPCRPRRRTPRPPKSSASGGPPYHRSSQSRPKLGAVSLGNYTTLRSSQMAGVEKGNAGGRRKKNDGRRSLAGSSTTTWPSAHCDRVQHQCATPLAPQPYRVMAYIVMAYIVIALVALQPGPADDQNVGR